MKKLAALALLTLLPLAANADMIILPEQPFSGTPNLEIPLTFDKFNTTLGTLTMVEVTMELNALSGSVSAQNESGTAAVVTLQGGPTATITSPDVYGIDVTAEAWVSANLNLAPFGDPGDSGSINVAGATDTDSDTINLPGLLTFFEYGGTGSSIYGLVVDATNFIDIEGDGGVGGAFTPSAVDGHVIVTYTYTPVPEPTSFAMFGVAMFGLARRRRKT